ncbi:PucR family transcriptional regulator [Rhodococcus sp. NPDC059234]|uniref:PucR family transcriptional regulator n=1 Tax=Rhodococcus sp. NPDC059234 TaxID=3346781 RepID=UPI00366E09B0
MSVSVRWVLAQPELALALKGGAAGLDREISFAMTTELPDPFRWLSGGELLLTTGLRLPLGAADRESYLRGLHECGVAAVGFGTGLSHASVPADLVAAADDLGLPLLEVPLPTPFAAITKLVTARLAEQQYEAVLRASRAQPRMTRAVIQGGARATVRELAVATSASVLLLDPAGQVAECHPETVDDDVLAELRQVLASGSGEVSSRVSLSGSGASIAVQQISVGKMLHGYLALISPRALSSVDQMMLGHANSLLALDFEKPARLRSAQNRLNSHALGLLLSEEVDLAPARAQIVKAADGQGAIRSLTAVCDTDSAAEHVAECIETAMNQIGRPLYLRRAGTRVTALLRGNDDVAFARGLLAGLSGPVRRLTRIGLSGPQRVDHLIEAIDQSQLAASAAELGSAPLEFAMLTGSALMSFASTREVLTALADTMIAPLVDHDARHGTELLGSLRAFLEANGHWESAAAALGVHRHTLRSRIRRIESLLNCELDSARVRAELLLAIIAYQS